MGIYWSYRTFAWQILQTTLVISSSFSSAVLNPKWFQASDLSWDGLLSEVLPASAIVLMHVCERQLDVNWPLLHCAQDNWGLWERYRSHALWIDIAKFKWNRFNRFFYPAPSPSVCVEKKHSDSQPSWPRLRWTFPQKTASLSWVWESDSI